MQAYKELFTTSLFLFSALFGARSVTVDCTTNPAHSTLRQLITCLDGFTVPRNTYNEARYNAAQPTAAQRAEWSNTITALLDVDGNCPSVTLSEIKDDYTVSLFNDASGSSYCVLSESNADYTGFKKGWGTFIVPANRAAVLRHIHISAPHPHYDVNTPEQAAAVFQSTGANSLLIAGRDRRAYPASTTCVIPNAQNVKYYKTDPAHDRNEPFFDASKAINNWQIKNGGCPSATCAYLQFHGKGSSTCGADNVFLSAGLGHTKASVEWYKDGVDRPVKRVKSQLHAQFASWNIALPSDDISCGLTATTNVVGRLLNGVDESRVCTDGSSSATGQFVHIEQNSAARDSASYTGWTAALKSTFPAV